MALKAVSSSDPSNFMYDTISLTPPYYNGSSEASFSLENDNAGFRIDSKKPFDSLRALNFAGTYDRFSPPELPSFVGLQEHIERSNSSTQGRKKRRRRPRICKSKEEAETQRMTHIAVERNRRKQMNDHLNVLRSLMPESYIQRGDQASIVGGAIEFVKELEQLLQSLEAQKHLLRQKQCHENASNSFPPPFMQFFGYPQYSSSQIPNSHGSETRPAIADVEVTLIESHANIRILSQKRQRHLLRMVAGLQMLRLAVLHLNVTTLEPFVLYSFSVKVEEGCRFASVDDIAGAVHHMLRIIEEEAATY